MQLAAIGNFRDLVEVVLTAVSILGGIMEYCSGSRALQAIRLGQGPEQMAF